MTVVSALVVLGASLPVSAAAAAPAVERIGGPARTQTAAALARAADPDPRIIYLVASSDFADGLAAGATAARTGGTVLLVEHDGVPAATRLVLQEQPDAQLVVVGGTDRLPAALDDEVEQLTGRRPHRIAGPERYATAAALARSAFPDGADHVWLVSGAAAPDALAAGAAAAATDAALLSTAPHALPASTRAALTALSPREVTVVGGRAAVTSAVLDQVAATLGADVQVERVGAADRYATSAAVAAHAFTRPTTALVTTGRMWVDALAATPLAAAEAAPVLLVPRRCMTAPVADVVEGVSRLVIAGGEAAVSPLVADGARCGEEAQSVTMAELGASWRPGCPVGPDDLRRVTVDHRTLEGPDVRVGHLIVHASVTRDVVEVFDRAFDAGFGLGTVANVAAYGASDSAAMAANATTAFNCRTVAGTSTWSQHAYGTAIDVNPVQNPYVSRSVVDPPAGAAYTDRTDVRPGMVVDGGPVEQAFSDLGWGWGGRWRSVKDYQHFSVTGR